MKRTLSAAILGFLFLTLPAFAGEFSGDYALAYPTIGLNVNFGVMQDGVFTGFDQTIPFGEEAQAYFDEKKAEALALIETLDLPEAARSQLIALVDAVFAALMNANDQLEASALEILPDAMRLDQLFWPFDSTILVNLDGVSIPWPGTIDPSSGSFDLMTVSLPLESAAYGDWNLSVLGILLGSGRIDRTAAYSAVGTFRVNCEMILEGSGRQIILGVGLLGDWTGIRS